MGGSEEPTGDQAGTPGVTEQLLDLMVYLPIGVATSVAEDLPRFAARGRSMLEGRIRTARGIGEVTVVLGRRTLASRLRGPEPTPAAGRPPAGPPPAGPPPAGPPPAGPPPASTDRAPRRTASVRAGSGTSRPRPADRGASAPGAGIDVDAIIGGYDTLPASQVVRRLDGLSPAELADIGRYESAGRGRRTILHRVHQIQSAAPDRPTDRPG